MSYEDLLKKITNIRESRIDARAAALLKPTRKSRPKKHDAEKLFDKMTDKEKQKLLESLGG